MTALPDLRKVVSQLEAHYGPPQPPLTTDPFELVLLENVGYLVSDKRRAEAFANLRKHTGTRPHHLLSASTDNILKATGLGGMHPEQRVSRLREIALIAINEFGGDLRQALKLPLPKAKTALRKFPGIGEPSAEKILLLTRSYPVLEVVAGSGADGVRITGNTTGALSPAFKLFDSSTQRSVLGLAEGAGNFSSDASIGDIVLRADTGKLLLQTGTGVSSMAIVSGQVGIGTTAPTALLSLN